MSSEADRGDALAERIFDAALGTMDLLGVYLGDRLGFYESLQTHGPLTAPELAGHSGADERYTREWLEQQAVTGFLEVDDVGAEAEARRYHLAPGHGEVLLDTDSLRYVGPLARMLTSAATRMPEILEAYRTGGGVPWHAFGSDMRESQGDINRPLFLHALPHQLAEVPSVAGRLRAEGSRVADVGCGVGWTSIGLARAYPTLTVDGFDPDEPAIELARINAREHGVADRVAFHAVDAASAAGQGTYDVVLACECIHDLSDPVAVLTSMRRLARDGGEVLVIDERVAEAFHAPGDDVERLMYGYSILICLVDGKSRTPTRATGTVMRPSVLRGYAREAGFSDIEVLPIEHDTFRYYRLLSD
jgi:2-polyprenyl-3-methyl-5-hydroxy-6-metoxy-1,4-benzoquinol methylase